MPAPFLLDTDHCIAYLSPRTASHGNVASRINSTPVQELRISVFSVLELAEGPHHSPTPQGRQADQQAIATLVSRLVHLPITPAIVQEFGRIRAELRKQGQIIGDMDIGIAATALAHGLTLVTHNTSHFNRIPGLPLEDWFV